MGFQGSPSQRQKVSHSTARAGDRGRRRRLNARRLAACRFSFGEFEQIEQVTYRRTIPRNVSIPACNRVGEVVAATLGDRRQIPVALDELENGNMISVLVRDVAARRVRGHNEKYNPRAIAEEVKRLNVA